MARTATMKVWNVELGLAVHIKSPNSKNIVIDLGTGKNNSSPLQKLCWESIHYMIITHPHLDHISDIESFGMNEPKILYHAYGIPDEDIIAKDDAYSKGKFKKYVDITKRYSSPVTESNINNPDNSSNYGGLEIQTFQTCACDVSNFNNFSIITVLSLSNCKIVVCGDNEKASLDILMRRSDFKAAVAYADVLVAPHHGRESGYHDEFVKHVHPKITIVSDTSKSTASASSKYTSASSGWKVHKSDGTSSDRYCLTTRNDGNILVEFGESDDPQYSGVLFVKTF